MSLKTYIDSGVLINAFSALPEVSINANQVLDDPSREFASSVFVRLETLPKAIYNKQQEEAEFYSMFFGSVAHWAIDLEQIYTSSRSHRFYLWTGGNGCFTHCCRAVDRG